MEMKKIACAILFAAASVSAVMADEVAAPAPSPTSGASVSLPVVGSLVGCISELNQYYDVYKEGHMLKRENEPEPKLCICISGVRLRAEGETTLLPETAALFSARLP
ncbi:hypothetical protein SADUNF_Sadunf16G0154600 [Salix dunnii]|uniref:Secreted protein n=1 Tax=Salix dunnii TaxID=1413687 RepID=A0A835MJ66_9ROSI|nr:hypothetical protein SADUNF_Sadunf16G0154600 [Salix dunnii]